MHPHKDSRPTVAITEAVGMIPVKGLHVSVWVCARGCLCGDRFAGNRLLTELENIYLVIYLSDTNIYSRQMQISSFSTCSTCSIRRPGVSLLFWFFSCFWVTCRVFLSACTWTLVATVSASSPSFEEASHRNPEVSFFYHRRSFTSMCIEVYSPLGATLRSKGSWSLLLVCFGSQTWKEDNISGCRGWICHSMLHTPAWSLTDLLLYWSEGSSCSRRPQADLTVVTSAVLDSMRVCGLTLGICFRLNKTQLQQIYCCRYEHKWENYSLLNGA